VPLTIGWGAVALFLRHLPRDSETLLDMEPSLRWSDEAHMLANLTDLIGDLFAKDYEHIKRPGAKRRYSTAEAVGKADHDALMALFGG
jgi:hypothetical protein